VKNAYALLGVLFLVLIVGSAYAFNRVSVSPGINNMIIQSMTDTLSLTSSAFENGKSIPSKYTCDGNPPAGGVSPPLSWSGVPEGATSLVLIMDDPDAIKPAGKVWDHWVVFNIPPDTVSAEEGRGPNGVQGVTSSGKGGYGGPCPPDAKHRYFFRLYALDSDLSLEEGATKADVLAAMDGHIIGQGELMGKYQRTASR